MQNLPRMFQFVVTALFRRVISRKFPTLLGGVALLSFVSFSIILCQPTNSRVLSPGFIEPSNGNLVNAKVSRYADLIKL